MTVILLQSGASQGSETKLKKMRRILEKLMIKKKNEKYRSMVRSIFKAIWRWEMSYFVAFPILLDWGKLNTCTLSRHLCWLLIIGSNFISPFTLRFILIIGQNPFSKNADSSDVPALKSGKKYLWFCNIRRIVQIVFKVIYLLKLPAYIPCHTKFVFIRNFVCETGHFTNMY